MQLNLKLNPSITPLELFGPADKNLKLIREKTNVQITARGSNILLKGKKEDVNQASGILDNIQSQLAQQGTLSESRIMQIINQKGKLSSTGSSKSGLTIPVYSPKNSVEPSTTGQLKYVQTMLENDLTFCTGPAGTGKTYLAVAVAVSMLKRREIRRIVLARPAVEAGEKLGFLPGDMQAKVNPYLRPLFDALEDMMDFTQTKKFMELDIIEIIPLAFMRGRTINDAVVICDEAQNTSPMQMLMVLTRLGNGSKMIITGDITQVDLEPKQNSGMVEAIETLKRIRGIGVVELTQKDIVRHRLVQNIVRAYKRRTKTGK